MSDTLVWLTFGRHTYQFKEKLSIFFDINSWHGTKKNLRRRKKIGSTGQRERERESNKKMYDFNQSKSKMVPYVFQHFILKELNDFVISFCPPKSYVAILKEPTNKTNEQKQQTTI